MKKPFKSPILCKIFSKRFIYEKDRNAYYSSLYSDLKKFIYDQKAVSTKECYFAMEELGYPPLDVHHALKRLRGIQTDSITRARNPRQFYFYGSMKLSKKWDRVRKETMKKKIQLEVDYKRRYLDTDRKKTLLEDLVHDTAIYETKYLKSIDLRTYKFAGKKDTSKKKEIDVIAYGMKADRFYGIECKAWDDMIDVKTYSRDLKSHINKCKYYSENPRKITLHPVFVVRLCSDTTIEAVESDEGQVIQTEKIWFSEENRRLNERMKTELHRYFYTFSESGQAPKSLVKKLDALEREK